MKVINTKNLDQDEARTLIAQLGLHAAQLRGLLSNGNAETIQPPPLAADDDIAGIDLLVKHITELETRLGGSAPAFNLATRAAFRSQSGSAAGRLDSASSKLSLTGRVLKARGVGSLPELRAKLSDMSHDEKMQSAKGLKTDA